MEVDTVMYGVANALSIVSIFLALSRSRLKEMLEDALCSRLVVLCGLSLAYESKFRLGREISYFRFVREYGYTLIAVAQTAHFIALTALITDAFYWLVSAKRRLQLGRNSGVLLSRITCAVVVSSAISIVCYVQFFRGRKSEIFLPKQLAELFSVPLALIFFVTLVFLRSCRLNGCYRHRTVEIVLSVYIRTIVVTFAINCLHLILIMTKTDETVVRFIRALNGCFFSLIACKLERLDIWISSASSLSISTISRNTLDINEPRVL